MFSINSVPAIFKCNSLCIRIGCQRFFLPVSFFIEERCQQRTHAPAYQQGDPEYLISSVWKFRGSGEEGQTVSQRHTDHHGGDHGDPHRCHGITCSTHDAGEGLGDRHGEIADGENLHHIGTEGYQFGCIGKDCHKIFAEDQD